MVFINSLSGVMPSMVFPRDDKTRTAWGYTFQLTENHPSRAALDPMKYSYDTLGEQALDRLNAISPPIASELPRSTSRQKPSNPDPQDPNHTPPRAKRDLYTLLRENAPHDPILSQLWTSVSTVPAWVDWAQISRGQECFYRYGAPNIVGLAFQSLLGGMGSARVVETLARTGGFSTKVARHRLYETTQHILQCTRSLESLQPGGEGFASSIRVRLLHAAVRQRIMRLAGQRPEYYDVANWGVPINDLDSVGTILTFSATLVWVALPRQGIFMREEETRDFIALWRYIAYLTGTPTDVFETPERARRMMEVLILYEIHPSETGRDLASNLIRCLEAQPPSYASRGFLMANARWLNGNALCDALGMERPGWYYWALMAGQCLFFMGLCYTYRSFPSWDRRKIQALRRVFWKVIVESEYGLGEASQFEFKYVPELGKRTRIEDALGDQSGIRYKGVERRNLQAFAIGSVLVGVGGYLCLKLGLVILRKGIDILIA